MYASYLICMIVSGLKRSQELTYRYASMPGDVFGSHALSIMIIWLFEIFSTLKVYAQNGFVHILLTECVAGDFLK